MPQIPSQHTQTAQLAVVVERVEQIYSIVSKVENKTEANGRAVDALVTRYEVEHSRVVDKAQAAHTRIDELKCTVEDLKKAIAPLIPAYKAIMWLGGVIGVTLVAFIWSLITGQVVVVVP